MNVVNADYWSLQPRSAGTVLRTFDGDLTCPFHEIRTSLKFALIRWHQTGDAKYVRKCVRNETAAYCGVYDRAKRLTGIRDDFEMHLLMALAISNERELAASLRKSLSFRSCRNGYAYYAGFKQAMLAMLLNDSALAVKAIKRLSAYNATKYFYFPSKSVIFAALDGDVKKLAKNSAAIAKKFNGYASKTRALDGDTIDAACLDSHWFSPYPDWAFYIQAIRRYGSIEFPSNFWMPRELLESLASLGKRKTAL